MTNSRHSTSASVVAMSVTGRAEPRPANLEECLAQSKLAVMTCERLSGGGYTSASRWHVELLGGVEVFVKAAVDAKTAEWLRAEWLAYSTLQLDCMPGLLGWHEGSDEGGDWPVMMIEWLSGGRWVPAWQEDDLWAVKEAFGELEGVELPRWVGSAAVQWAGAPWAELLDEPAALKAAGVGRSGVVGALAERLCGIDSDVLAGDTLVHGDVRSDNIYIARDGKAKLFDWNWASAGGVGVDEALWVVSLLGEGIVPVGELGEGSWDVVAFYAGVLAQSAGRPGGPRVREMQKRQLRAAVEWLGSNAE